MKSRKAWIAATLLVAACGASPDGKGAAPAKPTGVAGSVGVPDSATARVGADTGTVTLPRGRVTYSWPATIGVEAFGPGMLDLSVRDFRAHVDHFDIAPPDDRSFPLPDGERVTLNSIHIRLPEDGKILEISLSGYVDSD